MTTNTSLLFRKIVRWLAWLPLVISIIGALWIMNTQFGVCAPLYTKFELLAGLSPVITQIGFGILCGLIVTRQPQNRIGWLCGVVSLLPILLATPTMLLECVDQGLIRVPGLNVVMFLSNLSLIPLSVQFVLLPLWFPDGRFLSNGWRRFAILFYEALILLSIMASIWPGTLVFYGMISATFENPFGLPFRTAPQTTSLLRTLIMITAVGGILIAQFSLFDRWRRSGGQTRQQLKVLAFFVVGVGSVFMLFQLAGTLLAPAVDLFGMWGGWMYLILLYLLWGGYPIAIGLSVLRYRLYDVDLVIRRTLGYALLSGMLALVYFGVVVSLQAALGAVGNQSSPVVIVLSTLAIAALFNPLRRRIQNFIDRRFYRRKYDAEQALAEFAETARRENDLGQLSARLTNTVQETLQPRQVSLWLKK